MEVSSFTQINLSEGTFRDVVERVVENNGLKRGVIALGEMSKNKFVRVFANEPIRSEIDAIQATGRLIADLSSEGYLDNEDSERLSSVGFYPVDMLDRKSIENVMKLAQQNLRGSKASMDTNFVGLVDASEQGKVELSGVKMSENSVASVTLELNRF